MLQLDLALGIALGFAYAGIQAPPFSCCTSFCLISERGQRVRQFHKAATFVTLCISKPHRRLKEAKIKDFVQE